MKIALQTIASLLLAASTSLYSQTIKLEPGRLEASHVYMLAKTISGKQALQVIKDSTVTGSDEPTFARIKEINFTNGTIVVSVLSRLLKNAPAGARGFIGIAFRISEGNSRFECIYIRPTNGRADDQVRRNHSTQYFSFPDFKFDRLRKESPEKYESYADMGLDEWINLKIEVKGKQAKLFINDNKEPSLIVNDLKLGDSSSGAVGLYVDNGTEGYFADLRIHKD